MIKIALEKLIVFTCHCLKCYIVFFLDLNHSVTNIASQQNKDSFNLKSTKIRLHQIFDRISFLVIIISGFPLVSVLDLKRKNDLFKFQIETYINRFYLLSCKIKSCAEFIQSDFVPIQKTLDYQETLIETSSDLRLIASAQAWEI